jgi:lactate racemase
MFRSVYNIITKMNCLSYSELGDGISLKIPKENYLGCIRLEEAPELASPEAACRHVLKKPYGTARLRELALGKKCAVILVSDYTRAIHAEQLLPPVIEELCNAGMNESQITLVIACGTHRPSTPEEITSIVGHEWVDRLSIINHNAQDEKALSFIGKTSRDTPVWINKLVQESDLRIALGQIELHEFAGFSGGAKSILPGISGQETVRANHSPEMIGHPLARPGVIEGNPVREDMVEAASMVGLDFIVNVTRNMNQQVTGVFAGDMIEAHKQGVAFISSYSRVEFSSRPDIIVTTPGEALAVDFYQSLKPVIALDAIASRGTIIVLHASCPDVLGSMGDEMIKAFTGANSPEEVIEKLKRDYQPQMDHALLLSRLLAKGVKVIVSSPNVPAKLIEQMLLVPAESAQQALDLAMKLSCSECPSVLVYPQAERTLPVLT